MPDYPDDCRQREAHAGIKTGDELRSVLVRERAALDRQNERGTRCGGFYDVVKAKFGGKQ